MYIYYYKVHAFMNNLLLFYEAYIEVLLAVHWLRVKNGFVKHMDGLS